MFPKLYIMDNNNIIRNIINENIYESQQERNKLLGISSPYCEENFLNIDENVNIIKILPSVIDKHYKKRNQALTSLMKLMKKSDKYYINFEFINNFNNYIRIDDPCICNLIKKDINNLPSCKNNEKQPKYLYLDCSLSRGKIGQAFKLSGRQPKLELTTSSLIVKSIKNTHKITDKSILDLKLLHFEINKINLQDYPSEIYPSINYNYFNLENTKQHAILSIGGGNFENQTCIHMILNLALNDIVPNYVKQYDAFYCSEVSNKQHTLTGFNITEYADMGDLSDYFEKVLTEPLESDKLENIFDNIMKNLLLPLSILKCKKYAFVHGDLKCKNIFIKSKNSAINSNEYIFKLADFDKSSIFWRGLRFYNNGTSTLKKLGVKFLNLLPKIKTAKKDGILYYFSDVVKTKYSFLILQSYSMFGFIPIFMTHDIYTLFLSIFKEPSVWKQFYSFEDNTFKRKSTTGIKFFKLWERMWFEDDFDIMEKELTNLHLKYYFETDSGVRKKLLTEFRSIRNLNSFLVDNKIKMKYDLDFIFNSYNLYGPNNVDEEIDKFKTTTGKEERTINVLNGDHFCIDECIVNWNISDKRTCRTTPFKGISKKNIILKNFDYC
jgi:Protein kinase domain.